MSGARRALRTGLFAVTAVALIAPAAHAVGDAGASEPLASTTPAGGHSCDLTKSTFTATATISPLQDQFWDYADAADDTEWAGADSTYSVPLGKGRTAWIFSDTFLGPSNADGTRPETAPFLNNSIVTTDKRDRMRTVTGAPGDDGVPTSIVPQEADGSWHWFGDGELRRDGALQVGVLQFSRFGEGPWDWGWDSNELAVIDTTTWQVEDLVDLPSERGVQWASWYQKVRGFTYVYGVEDLGAEKNLHIARVPGSDLTRTRAWQYWDGERWSRHETDSVAVLPHVANEYSVTPFRDGYLLVTQDTSVPFNPSIEAYVACSPQGPFTHATRLYDMPEIGPDGSYGNPNVIAYNAHEHPQLRDGDTLTVSHNVNSMVPDDLYDDVTIYRPRFVSIDLTVTP